MNENLENLSDVELFEYGTRDHQARKAAFRAVHNRFESYVRNHIIQFAPGFSETEREEILARTWQRIWRHFHRYDPAKGAKPRTWLTHIARNLCKNRFRDVERNPTVPVSTYTANQKEEEDRTFDESVDNPDANPVERVEKEQLRRMIREEIEKMEPPFYRPVLRMRILEDRRYRIIADRTGVPLGTVKSRINRGREKLAAALKERFAEQPEILPEDFQHLAAA